MNSEAFTAVDLAIEADRFRRSAHRFIFSGELKTKDEHDSVNPVKPVPDHPYLRVIVDLMLLGSRFIKVKGALYALEAGLPDDFLTHIYRGGILLVEKSRDLFITNIICCFCHWRAKYHRYQLILIQSKNEEDAANLVFNKEADKARLSFQEFHLPASFQTTDLKKSGSYGHLHYPNGSHTRGIAQGGHIIRSEHPSMIVADEAAFQDEFGASFTAALPACQGGGFYLAVSSAEPGEFQVLVDWDKPSCPTKIMGLKWRVACESLPVLRVHYSAHPERIPGTPEGEKWKVETARRYPAGVDSPRWRKEQEIDYLALSGTRLFPRWEQWTAAGKIVVAPFEPVGYKLYGSYDHGWRNPASYHVYGQNGDGEMAAFFEFYGSHVPYTYIARIIKGEDVTVPVMGCCEGHPSARHFKGNPFGQKEIWKRADPSIWANDQPQKDGTNKSTAFLFAKEGIYFQQAERGTDTTIAEWLLGYYWKDPEKPLFRITTECSKLVWEIGQQRHREFSAHVALNREQPEELIDKDNHSWDDLKYFLQKFPPKPSPAKDPKIPNTFSWWQNMAKEGGIQRGTFRI